MTFPVQHWVARSVAADGDEGAVRRGAAAGGWALVLGRPSVRAGAGAWLLREPLFGADGGTFPLLVWRGRPRCRR